MFKTACVAALLALTSLGAVAAPSCLAPRDLAVDQVGEKIYLDCPTVPTMSEWGLAGLGGLMVVLGATRLRRRSSGAKA